MSAQLHIYNSQSLISQVEYQSDRVTVRASVLDLNTFPRLLFSVPLTFYDAPALGSHTKQHVRVVVKSGHWVCTQTPGDTHP